ncbi:hypothetical protein EYB53_013800 [Candidatus Chloroploca sp. M-50]|uniref:DUF2336 domain-containing protein n=1 Tax=Candidatus Chloroploca mongolica TaxID=2528176 RepID=A0ABS4DBF0_9CHLR|nr:hypothetical protein [Candidatus Chloroploca mongolica]MBP1466783.1 hypothetical protein [Candidatus Chloroploca mongolica]
MPDDSQFHSALRKLDEALQSLPDEPSEADRARIPLTEMLTRLVVGIVLLGLDALAARSVAWENEAGLVRDASPPVPAAGEPGSARFRQALIGWIFESEQRLRPQGSPVAWLRSVITYLFGTLFAVLIELLPLPRPGFRRTKQPLAEPTDEETRRWISRGRDEEVQSRRLAAVALEDGVNQAIIYLARRPAVAQALGEIVRSPAMDDAARHLVAGPVVDEAIKRVIASPALDDVIVRVGQSPALDQVITQVAQSPALDAVMLQVANSPALDQVITQVAQSPALDAVMLQVASSPALDQVITQVAQSPALDAVMLQVASSPALDQVIDQIAQRPALEQAVSRIVHSPVIEEAVSHIVRTPAMEDAVKHLVSTQAMNEAIDTLAQSPALVSLVTTQGSSLANEVLGQVRSHAIKTDDGLEGLLRRLLRRRPRAELPDAAQGLLVDSEALSARRLRSRWKGGADGR